MTPPPRTIRNSAGGVIENPAYFAWVNEQASAAGEPGGNPPPLALDLRDLESHTRDVATSLTRSQLIERWVGAEVLLEATRQERDNLIQR